MDIRRLSRREALRGVGMLTAGLVLGPACTKRVRPYVLDSPVGIGRHARHFTPVNVARDRVIRTVVGLRPYRPSGFVVRAESLGDKLLVHNYGHGGGGMTLSWGTARLSADLVSESGRTGAAAVIVRRDHLREGPSAGDDVQHLRRKLVSVQRHPSGAPDAGVGRAVRTSGSDCASPVSVADRRRIRGPLARAIQSQRWGRRWKRVLGLRDAARSVSGVAKAHAVRKPVPRKARRSRQHDVHRAVGLSERAASRFLCSRRPGSSCRVCGASTAWKLVGIGHR